MRVTVVLPALNEEATVGSVVRAIKAQRPDEIIVVDADSHDRTAAEAANAGAVVKNWRDILPEVPVRPGKGESLWRSVAAVNGDVIVFADADLRYVQPDLLSQLTAPFANDQVHLVKADYQRTLDGAPSGGGRVTELTAKPLLRMLFPEVAHINQPLAGEYAIRRDTARELPFVGGFGVEAGLLIDVVKQYGPGAVAQAPLGPRVHRNKPLSELTSMADVVAATILSRAEIGEVEQRSPINDYDVSR